MAQTKKKRRTKHRGNAAGVVESRGRTGRRLTDAERSSSAKKDPKQARLDRLNRPPSWRGAANRSLVAVVIFVAVLILFFKQSVPASISLGAFLLVLYIPLSYYTDLWLYRRRQRKQLEARSSQGRPKAGDGG
jgi:hypothetical protein